MSEVAPWEILKRETKGTYRVFEVEQRRNRSPLSGKEGDFFVLKSSDWINVIPVTENNEVVLIEQYRHGSDTMEWEIPGGCVDPGESALDSAVRELREETGYEATEWLEIGTNSPNPALNTNVCTSFLARGAHRVGEQSLDGNEEIRVFLKPLAEIPRLIRSGKIRHSLVITAFYFLDHWSGS